MELFQAIRQLKAKHPDVQFDFIGWYEGAFTQEVEDLQSQGLIRYHGFQDDVRPFIIMCHWVLPPILHEGMSNTLLESAAMGRPLIANRIHGCMEAVEGSTVILVPKGRWAIRTLSPTSSICRIRRRHA